MKTDHLDVVDRQLYHAIVASPRASFRLLGEVIGVSDQTVARRYRRLVHEAGLRVSGVVNGQRAGWIDWFVRLQTTPGSASRLADALARRTDTRWVRLSSGGTEVTCTLQARTQDQHNALFLQGLPGSRHVTAMSAHSVLHAFSPVEYYGEVPALSAGQLEMLRAASPPGPGRSRPPESPQAAGARIRAEDGPLLAELAADGRAPVAALAAATHWHESTVRRRIEELQQAGLVYFDVDVDDAILGIAVNAMLWISVEPAHLAEVGQAMAGHPQVPFVGATTGPTNLAASCGFASMTGLYDYLTTELAGLPGVRSVETAPIIGTIKRTSTARRQLAPAGAAGG